MMSPIECFFESLFILSNHTCSMNWTIFFFHRYIPRRQKFHRSHIVHFVLNEIFVMFWVCKWYCAVSDNGALAIHKITNSWNQSFDTFPHKNRHELTACFHKPGKGDLRNLKCPMVKYSDFSFWIENCIHNKCKSRCIFSFFEEFQSLKLELRRN